MNKPDTTSITCGCCGFTHTSVQEVRDCYDDEAYAQWEHDIERASQRAWENQYVDFEAVEDAKLYEAQRDAHYATI